MSFIATQNKGFRMEFDNGFSISVQWGIENYCEKKSFNTDIDPTKERIWESTSAEIAVFDDEGIVPVGGDDQVIGWLSPDEVAKYIAIVSSATNKNEIETKIKELGEAK
tara:strand:- start:297 stop:623 length:327 start_codon:yes stop_codon:yes gene_type:complete